MSFKYNENPSAVPDFLKSLIKLNELQRMTENLDEELADSQQLMSDMKKLFDSMPLGQNAEPVNYEQHEALAQFLQAAPPQLLMDDMPASSADVDLDNIIATMKVYTEELRKNLDLSKPECKATERSINDLDLGGYVSNIDQLVKRLASMKINKHDDAQKNTELEAKLQQLCNDGKLFTQMVESLKSQGEATSQAGSACRDPLVYDNLVNKLLVDINEVTYFLKNQN